MTIGYNKRVPIRLPLLAYLLSTQHLHLVSVYGKRL